MLKRIRKSSTRVTLVLIGLAGLAGCGGEDRRDVYASREDCLADWGNKPEDCTPATQSRHSSRGFFYGPSYSHASGGWFGRSGGSYSGSSGSSSRSIGSSSSTSRGGFGSSGHSSSS
jgi:uncharacterized protein YgiB involved in biofilm formation